MCISMQCIKAGNKGMHFIHLKLLGCAVHSFKVICVGVQRLDSKVSAYNLLGRSFILFVVTVHTSRVFKLGRGTQHSENKTFM